MGITCVVSGFVSQPLMIYRRVCACAIPSYRTDLSTHIFWVECVGYPNPAPRSRVTVLLVVERAAVEIGGLVEDVVRVSPN